MSDNQHDDLTSNTRIWRLGGSLSADERKAAKKRFLENITQTHNVTLACDYANISRQAAYQWRKEDEAFADAWEDALERARDVARQSIYQRGIIGVEEPVVSMGQVVYEYEPELDASGNQMYERGKPLMKRGKPLIIRKYSDSLATLYARSNLPEYKEKQQLDIRIEDVAQQGKDELLAGLADAKPDN